MVYGLAASSDSNLTPYKLKRTSTTPLPKPTLVKSVAPLKANGAIDFLIVLGDGQYPDSSFIADCKANGVTCGINNSNDGTSSNWSLSYYQQLASSGVQWAIGESESGAEMCAMMQASPGKLIAGTYGGQGTGGPTGNNDIWAGNNYTPNCTVKPGTINIFLETYTASSMISASEIGTEAGINKDHGTFEQGLCIGTWAQADYGADANTYAEMVDEMASNKAPCCGFQWWYTQGGFAFPSIFSDLMAMYPPNMTPILQRATPTPTSITFNSSPAACSIDVNTLDIFAAGSDNALWHKRWTSWTPTAATTAAEKSSGWTPWDSLGGITTSAPAAVARDGGLDVFVRGTTGALWYKRWAGTWSEWTNLGGVILKGTAPTADSRGPTVLDVFVIGTTGALWQRTLSAGVWSQWIEVDSVIQ